MERDSGRDAHSHPRPGRYFGTTPEFWLNLQSAHDLPKARAVFAARIEAEVNPRAA
jgi:plasmid maintenance system antidote protein VapI